MGLPEVKFLFAPIQLIEKQLPFPTFGIQDSFIILFPQQIKVRNAPDVKITATLIRPVPVGRSLTLGGTTDITCNSLNVTVQSPTGQTFTANSSGRSVGKSVTLTSAGLYTITVTAQKTASSTPVVYVYTVRAY